MPSFCRSSLTLQSGLACWHMLRIRRIWLSISHPTSKALIEPIKSHYSGPNGVSNSRLLLGRTRRHRLRMTIPSKARLRSLKAAAGIVDRGGLGIFYLSQPTSADHPHHNHQQSAEETAFRTDSAAGQPSRARRTRIQKMTGVRMATVGHTIKVCLAPVEGRVESDRHPEIASST